MFKIRGKPEHPKNVKYKEDCKFLSEAIHVNQLCHNIVLEKACTSKSESLRRQKHFEEFKQTYQQRLQKAQKKYEFSNKIHSSIAEGRQEVPNKTAQKVQLHVQRPTFTDIKTVKVEAPAPDKSAAIWSLTAKKSKNNQGNIKLYASKEVAVNQDNSDTLTILRKINALEEQRKSTNQVVEPKDLLTEIQEANEQVDVASLQLKHINNLISCRRTSVTKENADSTGIPRATKWHVRDSQKPGGGDKSKKLMDTLNTLNKRLQGMQDKMNKTRIAYRSLDDFIPKQSGAKELGKNSYYSEKKSSEEPELRAAMSKFDFEHVLDTLLSNKGGISKLENPYKRHFKPPLESIVEKEEEECVKEHASPHATRKRSAPFNLKDTTGNTSNVDVLYFPKAIASEVESKYNLVMDKSKLKSPKQVTEFIEGDDDITISSIFNPKLRESVKKSQYLSKELAKIHGTGQSADKSPSKQTKEQSSTTLKKLSSVQRKTLKLIAKDRHKRKVESESFESAFNGTIYSSI